MNKKIATICLISVVVCSAALACSNGPTSENKSKTIVNIFAKSQSISVEKEKPEPGFTPEKIEHLGNHIYYSSHFFDYSKKENKSWIKKYMKGADNQLTEDVYVTGCGGKIKTKRFYMYGIQYSNGVLIPGVEYRTSGKIKTSNLTCKEDIPPVTKLDTSQLLDPNDLIPIVTDLADKNKHKINLYHGDYYYGTYRLEYDIFNDQFIYIFELNEYSKITIDAETGEILYEYYWNGNVE